MRNKRFKNDSGDWCYTNSQEVTKKLLFNTETNKPYKIGDVILQ